jgi:cytochrome c
MKRFSGLALSLIGAAALLVAAQGATNAAPAAGALQAGTSPSSFGMCKACHSVTRGGAAGIGPNLFGVVGAAAGSRPGYSYSPAMKASKIRWDRTRLDAFLTDPKALVPGNKMPMAGIKDAAKREEIVDYLATLK